MEEIRSSPPMNRNAVLSLAAGAMTLASFCVGVAPIPFTDFMCYSASLLFGVAALSIGFTSLWQIRRSGESGSSLAWTGIFVGGFTMLAAACIVAAIALAFPSFEHYVQQAWVQLRH
jgi:hypothetical protein